MYVKQVELEDCPNCNQNNWKLLHQCNNGEYRSKKCLKCGYLSVLNTKDKLILYKHF